MPIPNFLIIGAQKCGTTALYETLRQHPQIFMSPVKEPFYFVLNDAPPPYRVPSEEYAGRLRSTWPEYQALFEGVTSQRAIGEASALYLSSFQPEITAARIQEKLPTVRLIALVRHPVDRAYSAFCYYHMRGFEPSHSFTEALAAETLRDQHEWCPDLRYIANGRYYATLKPYFDRFPREQIRVYLYEDWNQRPQAVLRDIYAFLEVDEDVRIEPQRANVTFGYRHLSLQRFLDEPNALRWMVGAILPGRWRARIFGKLRALNRRSPPALDPGLRRSLTEGFRSDIEQLQTLLGRDLSQWLNG